jgi:hypothetical protein
VSRDDNQATTLTVARVITNSRADQPEQNAAIVEAYGHVADGCRRALTVPGLPASEVEALRRMLRAACAIAKEQPLARVR